MPQSAATLQAPPLSPGETLALLRLLDDETPEVRSHVAERLAATTGDMSEVLAGLSVSLTAEEHGILSSLLAPARRATLRREWVAPTAGAHALGDDWEGIEALLRLLSDFLHDGISLRQPLPDALDLLTEEASESHVATGRDLAQFLFAEGKLQPLPAGAPDPDEFDLAGSIANGKSGDLSLCLIYTLIGQRLGIEVDFVPYPSHYLARYYDHGIPVIVDCYGNGQLHLQSTLLEDPQIRVEERKLIAQAADPGSALVIYMNELTATLTECGRAEDAQLVNQLRKSLL